MNMIRPSAFDSGPLTVPTVTEYKERGTLYEINGTGVLLSTETETAIPAFAAMKRGMESIIAAIKNNVEELNPSRVPQRDLEVIKTRLRPLARGAQDGALKYAEDHAINKAKYDALSPVVDAAVESAHRERFPDTLAKRLVAVRDWSIDGVIAVARLGREAWGMTAEQWTAVEWRIRAHNLAAAPAVQTQFLRSASLAEPLARGIDPDAVQAFVEASVAEWKRRDGVVDSAARELQDLCQFVAVACSITTEQAYDVLFNDE